MYHYVREVDAYRDPLGYKLSITPAAFAAQLDWLQQQGYTPVRMDTALRCLQGQPGCPARPVALTFDDGYADAYTTVLPLLQERGFVATFYIVTGFVGQAGYMDWEHLRALRDAGMEIGAHSRTHPDLTTLPPAQAYAEIADSRRQLAERLGIPITSFCYPAGKFTYATRAQVADIGFTNATTTLQGWDYSDAYLLPRLRIEGGGDLQSFAWLVQAHTP
jgi:peptidoglycan/xylan/chitin deacetylase (PgdA/CDA1 family)